jgi:hypothetical protein
MKRMVLAGIWLAAGAAAVSGIGWSFFACGGYGLGLDGEAFGTEVEVAPSGFYETYANYFTKPGQAVRVFGEANAALSDHFCIGLGGGYTLGDPWGGALAFYHEEFVGNRTANMSTSFVPLFLTLKGRIPLARFSFDFGVGPSVGILAKSKVTDTQISGGVEEYWEIEGTYTAGWGFHGVAGVEFRLTKWLALRAEARAEQLTFRPKKAVITVYTVNGVDQLMSTYPEVSDREIVFVDDLDDYLNSPFDPDSPSQELAYNLSGDTVGAFLGLVFRIP